MTRLRCEPSRRARRPGRARARFDRALRETGRSEVSPLGPQFPPPPLMTNSASLARWIKGRYPKARPRFLSASALRRAAGQAEGRRAQADGDRVMPFDRLASEAATLPHANAPAPRKFRSANGSGGSIVSRLRCGTRSRAGPGAMRRQAGVNDAWETPG